MKGVNLRAFVARWAKISYSCTCAHRAWGELANAARRSSAPERRLGPFPTGARAAVRGAGHWLVNF